MLERSMICLVEMTGASYSYRVSRWQLHRAEMDKTEMHIRRRAW